MSEHKYDRLADVLADIGRTAKGLRKLRLDTWEKRFNRGTKTEAACG
jgi:hypothetical protein